LTDPIDLGSFHRVPRHAGHLGGTWSTKTGGTSAAAAPTHVRARPSAGTGLSPVAPRHARCAGPPTSPASGSA